MFKEILVAAVLALGCMVNAQYGLPPPPSYYPPTVQWNPVGQAPSYPTWLRYHGWNKDGYKWPKSSSSSSGSDSGSHERRRHRKHRHHRRHHKHSSSSSGDRSD